MCIFVLCRSKLSRAGAGGRRRRDPKARLPENVEVGLGKGHRFELCHPRRQAEETLIELLKKMLLVLRLSSLSLSHLFAQI